MLRVWLLGGSSEDCLVACLNNCSCNVYTYNSSGCFVWHGDMINIQEQYNGDGGGILFLNLAASELPGLQSSRQRPSMKLPVELLRF